MRSEYRKAIEKLAVIKYEKCTTLDKIVNKLDIERSKSLRSETTFATNHPPFEPSIANIVAVSFF